MLWPTNVVSKQSPFVSMSFAPSEYETIECHCTQSHKSTVEAISCQTLTTIGKIEKKNSRLNLLSNYLHCRWTIEQPL